MFVFKSFKDTCHVEKFKNIIKASTLNLDHLSSYCQIGFHSKLIGDIINIKDVSEISEHGGPIYIHFYGIILKLFKRNYLIGIFIPEIIYTLFTFIVVVLADEYLYFKIILLVIWLWIYLSNYGRIKNFFAILLRWFDETGDGYVS